MPRLTPEQFAQELIDQAWEEEDEVERMRLVLRALARLPDHADGYVLLANQVDEDLVVVRALCADSSGYSSGGGGRSTSAGPACRTVGTRSRRAEPPALPPAKPVSVP